jgi:hypothetical protein
VSPRYRNRVGKCQAGTGATVESMNRNFTSSSDLYEIAVTLAQAMWLDRESTFRPVELGFRGGGDGIRTHGLYIAKVEIPAF